MGLELYALGEVTKDYELGSAYLSIKPIDILTDVNGDPDSKTSSNTNIEGINGFTISSVTQSSTVRAKYLPLGNANKNPPCLCAGEKVFLFRYSGSDNFWWVDASNDLSLRKLEKVIMYASNKPGDGAGSDSMLYYVMLDTINKAIRLHTSNNDGEKAALDIDMDGKTGIITITDSMNNEIELDSVGGKINIKSVSENNIKTKDYKLESSSVTITNGPNELIDVLSSLVSVLADEVHIDSMNGRTKMDGTSKSKLADIKNKLDSFRKG